MSYEPLHHKYRPQTFADLVGQEAIATTLSNAIGQEKIAPAYLFTGPRGTGKTSSARILAKSLNCLSSNVPTATPCGKCDVCQGISKGATLDVIEIDAASNTGVDNIRELIERAQFAPVQCRYKVYIIDEVHMLSNAAFNALLKTLEEPPEQIVFVLATTDPQRVLPTIISRCQRFDFRRIPLNSMVNHLRHIAVRENININDEAISLVAQIAQGGLRDAESTLDQLSLLPDMVTIEKVWDLVGAVPEQDLMSLLFAIANDDAIAVLDIARRLMDRGREPLIVIQNLASFYRDLLIAKTAPNRADLVAVTSSTWENLCQFQGLTIPEILAGQKNLKESEYQLKNTTQPRLWLEVTLMGLLPMSINQQQTDRTIKNPIVKTSLEPKTLPLKPSKAPETYQPISENISVEPPDLEPPKETDDRTYVQIPKVSLEAAQISEVPLEAENNTKISDLSDVINEETEESSSEIALDEIWEKVIVYIHPPLTQVLFRQHGRLLNLMDGQALVGISSPPLLKTAKERLPNLETAFQKAINYQVKVNLSLGNGLPIQTDSAKQNKTYKPSLDPSNFTIQKSPTFTPPPSTAIAPSPPIVESEKSDYVTAPTYRSETKPLSPPAEPPVLDRAEKTNKQRSEQPVKDDAEVVLNAAKRLAEIFQGEIISIADDTRIFQFASQEQKPDSYKSEPSFTDFPEELENEDDDF